MSESKKWTPGEVVPKSATYSAYSRDGENGGSLYLEKGKRFPANAPKAVPIAQQGDATANAPYAKYGFI